MRFLKKYCFLFFYLLPCFLRGQSLPKVIFSHPAGYYSDSISLSFFSPMSGAQIRYTLNGDEPTLNSSLYSNPIKIKNRTHTQNTISAIPTNPSFNYPKPGYDVTRADSRGWLAQLFLVYQFYQ